MLKFPSLVVGGETIQQGILPYLNFDETKFDYYIAVDCICLGTTAGLLPPGKRSASEDAGCGTGGCFHVYGVQGFPRTAAAGGYTAPPAKGAA